MLWHALACFGMEWFDDFGCGLAQAETQPFPRHNHSRHWMLRYCYISFLPIRIFTCVTFRYPERSIILPYKQWSVTSDEFKNL